MNHEVWYNIEMEDLDTARKAWFLGVQKPAFGPEMLVRPYRTESTVRLKPSFKLRLFTSDNQLSLT